MWNLSQNYEGKVVAGSISTLSPCLKDRSSWDEAGNFLAVLSGLGFLFEIVCFINQ